MNIKEIQPDSTGVVEDNMNEEVIKRPSGESNDRRTEIAARKSESVIIVERHPEKSQREFGSKKLFMVETVNRSSRRYFLCNLWLSQMWRRNQEH